jgi:hypothetical protein
MKLFNASIITVLTVVTVHGSEVISITTANQKSLKLSIPETKPLISPAEPLNLKEIKIQSSSSPQQQRMQGQFNSAMGEEINSAVDEIQQEMVRANMTRGERIGFCCRKTSACECGDLYEPGKCPNLLFDYYRDCFTSNQTPGGRYANGAFTGRSPVCHALFGAAAGSLITLIAKQHCD